MLYVPKSVNVVRFDIGLVPLLYSRMFPVVGVISCPVRFIVDPDDIVTFPSVPFSVRLTSDVAFVTVYVHWSVSFLFPVVSLAYSFHMYVPAGRSV